MLQIEAGGMVGISTFEASVVRAARFLPSHFSTKNGTHVTTKMTRFA
jgi:hypothetical protein